MRVAWITVSNKRIVPNTHQEWKPMLDFLVGTGVIVFYFALQIWILPRLGVPT